MIADELLRLELQVNDILEKLSEDERNILIIRHLESVMLSLDSAMELVERSSMQ